MSQQTASAHELDRWCEHFDHHDPQLTAELVYEVYAHLRERRPIARSDCHGGFWILTRHEDVMAAAADWETFSSAEGAHLPRQPGQLLFVPLDYDPPIHTAYRDVFAAALTPARVRELEPQIRALASDLVGNFAAAGGGDFVAAVAVHFPIRLIASMLGLSDAVSAQIRDFTERIWVAFGHDARSTALNDLIDLLMAEAVARRAEPAADLLTELVQADVGGRSFTDDELRSTLAAFAIAGHETTMNASANLMHDLAQRPQLQEQLRDDLPALRRAIEESLRLRAPAHLFVRTVTRDTVFHGTPMRRGEKIVLVYASANRDEDQCPHAAEFDPQRRMASSLTFGWGIHRCVGIHLARAELRVLAQEMLARGPFELAGEVHSSGMEGGHHMGVRTLPLRFAASNTRDEGDDGDR